MIRLSMEQIRQHVLPMIFEYMGSEIGSQAKLDYSEDEDDQEVWGYFHENKLIGFAGIGSELSEGKINLGYFGVHHDHRKKGLGKKLLDYIENLAIMKNYSWIYIETYSSPPFSSARKFYKKMGYSEAGGIKGYLVDADSVIFRKKLR